MRGILLTALLALPALGCATLPAPPPAPRLPEPAAPDYLRGRALMVPVAGVSPEQVPDTFLAPRSQGRVHEATDILAPTGTPVLSADEGRVIRVGQNRLGGNIIYATDAGEMLVYYYAHLDRFAPGLAPGQPVRRGEVLGYVGVSGNAPRNTPHLHFQLMLRRADGQLHGGQPVDARPYFLFPGVPAPVARPGNDPLVSLAGCPATSGDSSAAPAPAPTGPPRASCSP